MNLSKLLIVLVFVTSALSLLVVVGLFGMGITGKTTAVNTALLDGLSIIVLWLIVLTLFGFLIDLIIFRRSRKRKY